ncbi:multiple sugar transport system substrate-binding protein [Nonomuraea thailandensis]|uniref:Multiple sugar transport system substrate-binding protein n=1 Tax=Nonomuraea thailandensis TaxID=1188745 RepID=A0A9X2GDC5_9ACTN|nr:extracellular solute-binding protein [Nonomuraea thailandensis]MCP2353221.1 multiple sugar transport system substrate-binding protein [Nonomuraea thailandensis]
MGSDKRMRTPVSAWLGTAILLIITACGGAGAGGEIKLRFSYWGTDVRQKRTEEAIKRFEAKNPDIDVVAEFSGFGGYYERLAAKVASGDAPDVITIEVRGLREYAERGTLADLSRKVDTADIDGKVLAAGAIDGKQFAVPTGVNTWSLVADPKAIQDAEQKLPHDATWTWNDYIDLAARITARTGGKVYGTQQAFNPAFLQIFAAQRGESFYDGNQIGMSPRTIKAWWAVHRQLIKTQGSPDVARSVELGAQGVDRSLFATGNGAMGMWWSNELGAIKKASGGKDMNLLRMPKQQDAVSGGMFLQPAMFYTASAKSEHPAEAARFIDFLVNDPEAGAIILSDRGLPANARVLAAVRDTLPETDQKTLAFLDEIKSELTNPPAVPPKGASAMEDILNRYTDDVLFGRMDPDHAAQTFITEANALIAG